jgi:hypothetical protein
VESVMVMLTITEAAGRRAPLVRAEPMKPWYLDDPQVQSEFEAIVAAEWAVPPRTVPRCSIGFPPAPPVGQRIDRSPCPAFARGRALVCTGGRQRGPPH